MSNRNVKISDIIDFVNASDGVFNGDVLLLEKKFGFGSFC